MEIDGVHEDVAVGKSFSVPGFLKNVLTEELGGYDDDISNRKLLAVALHAVLLESGFVGFDTKSKTEIKGFSLRNNWPRNSSEFSLFYTVPGIINHVLPSSRYEDAVIELKFHFNELFLNVFGSLIFWPPKHSISLQASELSPSLKSTWSNFIFEDEIRVSTTREILKFWTDVKDKFALPLLTDLCNKSGLQPPPCFLKLSNDLKLKILGLLPGMDVARMRCVSKELRFLASSDRHRKQKIEENSGNAGLLEQSVGNRKQKFARFLKDNRALNDPRQAKLKSHGVTHEKVSPVFHPYKKIHFHPYKKIHSFSRFPRNLRIDDRPPTVYFRWPRYDPRYLRKNYLFF